MFIGPGVDVYAGMVVGESPKAGDISVNVCKEKRLTNVRARMSGAQEGLDVPRTMSLEDALDYIGDDELVEVTPKSARIRKVILSEHERKRARKVE